MKRLPKTELSPDNGCVIDTKWKVGPLSYHACAATPKEAHGKPLEGNLRLPEIVVYDHIGFKGAYARTNLELPLSGRFLERPHQLRHCRQRHLAFLSRRILQGRLLGPRPRLLRKLLHRSRPRRRRQLFPSHRTDVKPIQVGSSAPVVRDNDSFPQCYTKKCSLLIANFRLYLVRFMRLCSLLVRLFARHCGTHLFVRSDEPITNIRRRANTLEP